jgi:class 3 adenylate cyclase/TolB-like protein
VIGMERVHLKRQLKAILLADVVGYSRLMSADEEGTHVKLVDYVKNLIEPQIAEYGGRLIRSMGDGFLVEFNSAADAVCCGLDLQDSIAERDGGADRDHQIRLRIGINTGDVISDDRDIYGNSVNIAARLEGLAEPGEIYVTRGVRDQLQGHPDLSLEDRGDRRVKNFERPIRVYRVTRVADQQWEVLSQGLVARARRLFRTRFGPHRRSVILMASTVAVAAVVTVAALPIRRDYSLMAPRASIMVLPFRNASNDPEQDYFADAVTDNLTTDLSRLSDTSVISPATAFTYKGKASDPREIGREFGVRYLLEGSIRKVGMKVQTNAHLVDTRSAAHIWADRFDNDLTELSELQDAITGRIASSLNIQLVQAENRRAIADRPADPDAIDLRLHAMALLMTTSTPEHHLSARQFLEDSVRLDPQSAESWGQLANVLTTDYFNHWNEAKQSPEAGKELLRRAQHAVQEALKIDPSIAVAHFADGFIRRAKGDHPGALDAFDRAVQLDPNFARARAQKANQLVLLGQPEEALPMVLQAIRLSPLDPAIGGFYWITGRAYFVMKKYKDAIVWLRKAAEVSPFWFNRAYLLAAYALTGQHQNPEGLAALTEYNSSFSQYTLQRLAEIYEKEFPHTDPNVQASIQELYRGLRLAGVPEQ